MHTIFNMEFEKLARDLKRPARNPAQAGATYIGLAITHLSQDPMLQEETEALERIKALLEAKSTLSSRHPDFLSPH